MARFAITAAACLTAALTPSFSAAQSNQQKPPKDECAELVAYVEAHDDGTLDVTLEHARSFDDAEACRAVLAKVMATAEGGDVAAPSKLEADTIVVEDGTEATLVEQPARQTVVEQEAPASPTIVVEQPKPEVLVRQVRPEILVRQPAPIVTVDIPQPEIIVRMADPAVTVAQEEPLVQADQPAEMVVGDAPLPQVHVDSSERPVIRYEREEPQVRINQPEGEPAVHFETAITDNAAPAPSVEITGSVNTAGTQQETARAVVVSSLAGLDVVNTVGEKVGTVDRLLVSDQDGRFYLVVAHGGFLGLGKAEALLPLDSVSIWENRLVVRDLTDDQIRQLPGWNDDKTYREVAGDKVAKISIAAR